MQLQDLELKVAIGAENYYGIKTQIKLPKVNENYYLPTNYKEPLKCRLVDYISTLSVDNIIRVMATVNIGKRTGSVKDINLKEVSPLLLFTTKNQAGQYYLENKDKFNWDYLFE